MKQLNPLASKMRVEHGVIHMDSWALHAGNSYSRLTRLVRKRHASDTCVISAELQCMNRPAHAWACSTASRICAQKVRHMQHTGLCSSSAHSEEHNILIEAWQYSPCFFVWDTAPNHSTFCLAVLSDFITFCLASVSPVLRLHKQRPALSPLCS